MQFIESRVGEFRIYVGALDGGRGVAGFSAALVITCERAGQPAEVCFRDDSLACGYRWPTAEQAMHYAMARGRERVRRGDFDVATGAAATAPESRAAC